METKNQEDAEGWNTNNPPEGLYLVTVQMPDGRLDFDLAFSEMDGYTHYWTCRHCVGRRNEVLAWKPLPKLYNPGPPPSYEEWVAQWKTASAIQHAAEREKPFFQIELDAEGNKTIHVDGYFYTIGEPGHLYPEKTWRHLYFESLSAPLISVLNEGFAEWYMRASEQQTQYVDEYTLEKVHEDALRYFNGEAPTPIYEQDLNINTPCGGYVLVTPEETSS